MRALLLGLSIGLAAGISPGPLLVLVITATLKHGWRAGVLAACAPLATDALVIVVALLLLDNVPPVVLAALGVLGGFFVVWTGVTTIRDARQATLTKSAAHAATGTPLAVLRQAALVNLLSPHPWVFWATALGPLIIATARDRPAHGIALGVGFYVTLVGAKAVVALLVAGGRSRLGDVGYRRCLVAAGLLLILVGAALAVEFAPQLRR